MERELRRKRPSEERKFRPGTVVVRALNEAGVYVPKKKVLKKARILYGYDKKGFIITEEKGHKTRRKS